jgi:hypothetical protein
MLEEVGTCGGPFLRSLYANLLNAFIATLQFTMTTHVYILDARVFGHKLVCH